MKFSIKDSFSKCDQIRSVYTRRISKECESDWQDFKKRVRIFLKNEFKY